MTRLLFFAVLDTKLYKFPWMMSLSNSSQSTKSPCVLTILLALNLSKLFLIILIFSCVFINFDVFYEISLKILCFVDIYTYLCTYQQTKIGNFMAKLSLRQRVLEMKIGERIVVPVKEHAYTTIRSYASDLGFATGRTYSTSRNREERTYTIIRRS